MTVPRYPSQRFILLLLGMSLVFIQSLSRRFLTGPSSQSLASPPQAALLGDSHLEGPHEEGEAKHRGAVSAREETGPSERKKTTDLRQGFLGLAVDPPDEDHTGHDRPGVLQHEVISQQPDGALPIQGGQVHVPLEDARCKVLILGIEAVKQRGLQVIDEEVGHPLGESHLVRELSVAPGDVGHRVRASADGVL